MEIRSDVSQRADVSQANLSEPVLFGSRRVILFVRISQIVMPMVMLGFSLGYFQALTSVALVAVLIVWETLMFCVVHAKLNEQGIAYLRWGHWKQANWHEIAYGGAGLVGFYAVRVQRGKVWNQTLLLRNPESKAGENLSLRPEVQRFLEAIEPVSGRTN